MSIWRRLGASKVRSTKGSKPESATDVPPNAWTVTGLLMAIDPPPVDGRDWLAGHNDGLYMAQCHLKGAAQGLAMQGRYAEAVAVAQQAVSLNGIRPSSSSVD